MTVEELFAGKDPALKAAYNSLLERLREFGDVREAPKQTSIHLENNSDFAGVYPRRSHFNLMFRTYYRLEDNHVVREIQVASRRFEHTVRIAQVSDVDDQLLAWLKDAYDQSQ